MVNIIGKPDSPCNDDSEKTPAAFYRRVAMAEDGGEIDVKVKDLKPTKSRLIKPEVAVA